MMGDFKKVIKNNSDTLAAEQVEDRPAEVMSGMVIKAWKK